MNFGSILCYTEYMLYIVQILVFDVIQANYRLFWVIFFLPLHFEYPTCKSWARHWLVWPAFGRLTGEARGGRWLSEGFFASRGRAEQRLNWVRAQKSNLTPVIIVGLIHVSQL